jgi:hypothetical protein
MTQTLMFPELAARDAALDRVLTNAGEGWKARALAIVRTLPEEVTGEDIRLACQSAGVTPHHHNAWGGFISSLDTHQQLTPLGRRVPMRAKGSHARKTDVYRNCTPGSSPVATCRS